MVIAAVTRCRSAAALAAWRLPSSVCRLKMQEMSGARSRLAQQMANTAHNDLGAPEDTGLTVAAYDGKPDLKRVRCCTMRRYDWMTVAAFSWRWRRNTRRWQCIRHVAWTLVAALTLRTCVHGSSQCKEKGQNEMALMVWFEQNAASLEQ